MGRFEDNTQTVSSPRRSFAQRGFPRRWIIWLGLIGFILGLTLCPFNPPKGGRTYTVPAKERTTMTTSMPYKKNSAEDQPSAVTRSKTLQTATFALG
jgi:hypothetical protein